MRRRDFITAFGGAAVVWPLGVRTQQAEKMRHIGVLMAYAKGDREGQVWVAALRHGLLKLGWEEGRNIQVTYGWAAADAEMRQRISKKFVAAQLDLILTQNTPTTESMVRQTRTILIIFANVSDPVGSSFVANFSRPGGNVTGFINFEGSVGSKWLELLKEIAPRVNRVAFLFNPLTAPFAEYYLGPFRTAGPSFGVEPITAPVRNVAELESTVAALARKPNGALIVMPETFLNVHRAQVLSLAARHRLPAAYPYRVFAKRGGLLSYGTDPHNNFRRAAAYVDRILKGEKPADLPVQAPTNYELVINLKTAKALGLTVPLTLLIRADEVIE
jgi:putative ABC transport system substrate-binding protein